MSKWSYDELALALELYLAKGIEWQNTINDSTPEVCALSDILRNLDTIQEPIDSKFRSRSSVRLKLANFKSIDNRYNGKALPNVGKSDKEIWNMFSEDYVNLKKYCRIFLMLHYCGTPDENVSDYLKTRYNITSKSLISEDSKKTVSSTPKHKSEKKKYKEHAGVNQKPLHTKKGVTEKPAEKTTAVCYPVGQYIRDTFDILLAKNLLNKQVISDLMSPDFCRTEFHLSHPFLKQFDEGKTVADQMLDINGHARYWKNITVINGTKYLLTKEWFSKQKKYYDQWLYKVAGSDPDIKRKQIEQFTAVIDSIIREDGDLPYFYRKAICDKYPDYGKEAIEYLLKKQIIQVFDKKAKTYIVDDYDALYQILEKPFAVYEEFLYERY